MTSYQRILLKAFSSRPFGALASRVLGPRAWRIEGGESAGLLVRLPQNLDYLAGSSELPVQRALARHLLPGDVYYDIGANVGFFALQAARTVGPTGAVCAFEPVPGNVAAIRENVALNGFGNVRLLDVAVGAAPGRAEFLVTEWDGGGSLVEAAVRREELVTRIQVTVEPLDRLIAAEGLPLPDFVKIDVEGAEMSVLDGMEETIRQCRPILLYEVDDGDAAAFERRWRELDERVAAFGYDVRRLENSYANRNWHVGHSLALPPRHSRTPGAQG